MVRAKASLIHYELSQLEAGTIAQQLRVLPALVEDRSLVPATHSCMTHKHPNFQYLFLDFMDSHAHILPTCTQEKK